MTKICVAAKPFNRWCVCRRSGNRESANTSTRTAIAKDGRWPTNIKIDIGFLNGDAETQDKVISIAREWQRYCGLSFDFSEPNERHVRIAFLEGDGSWSLLGSECLDSTDLSQPTMVLSSLSDINGTEFRSTVLHEFGHVIGLIHEHQSPLAQIMWNEEAVRQDVSGPPYNWTAQDIRNNITLEWEATSVDTDGFDPLSIMMYPISERWTSEPEKIPRQINTEISEKDKELVAAIYPPGL